MKFIIFYSPAKEFYSASWPEDTAINTVLVTVQATDPDDGKNGKVSYTIQGIKQAYCRRHPSKKIISLLNINEKKCFKAHRNHLVRL